jgi:hypothetical protein
MASMTVLRVGIKMAPACTDTLKTVVIPAKAGTHTTQTQ